MNELINIIKELTLDLETCINENYENTASYYQKECYLATVNKAKDILEKYQNNFNQSEGK
jgi:hypothetical protein